MFQSRLLRWENSRDTLLGGRNRLVSRFRMAEKTPSTNTHTHTHIHVGTWGLERKESHPPIVVISGGRRLPTIFVFLPLCFSGVSEFSQSNAYISVIQTHTRTQTLFYKSRLTPLPLVVPTNQTQWPSVGPLWDGLTPTSLSHEALETLLSSCAHTWTDSATPPFSDRTS